MNFRISDRVASYTVIATCLVVSTEFIDPINLPKLLVLVFGTSALVFSWFFEKDFKLRFEEKYANWSIYAFLIGLTIAAVASNQNIYRTLIGVNGRNNGYVSYLCLALIMFQGISYGKRGGTDKFIRLFAMLGLLQAIYGFMQMNHADFFHFVYGGNPIILTLGNEDFASLLLTLTVIATIYSLVESKKDLWKIGYSVSALFQSWIIININTAQSKLALTSGFIIFAAIYYITKESLNSKAKIGMSVSFVVILTVFFLGSQGRGPLSTINSNLRNFQSRVYHWIEAWSIFKSRPITGAGLDSYGQFQPYFKVLQADGTPDTYSNNAHNVFMQFLSTGGIVLLLGFLAILIFLVYRIAKTLFQKSSSPVMLAFSCAFLIVYFSHLMVGIDNLGIAVCFWFFSGLLIGSSYQNQKFYKKSNVLENNKSYKFSFIEFRTFQTISSILISLSLFVTVSESWAHLSISRLLISNGQVQVGQQDAENILSTAMKSQDPDLRMISIKTLYTIGALKQGYLLAKDTLKSFPRDLPTLDAVAIYYETNKNYSEALVIRQTMVEMDPLSAVLKQKLIEDKKLLS